MKEVVKMSQIKKGAIISYISIFASIFVALLYTPIMIRQLGESEYGLYALIGSVAAYFTVLDLGLGNAIVRYTSRNRATSGGKNLESKLNGMFLVLYSIIGVITVFIGLVVYNNIENIFGGSLTPTELDKGKIMIIILTINFALSFPLSVFGSIMQAYERFTVVKLIDIIRTLAIPIITVPFLFMGYGSITMVVITAVVNIACLLFNVYYAFKHLSINFYFGKMDVSLLKGILGYSFFIFLNVIIDQVYWKTDQVILGVVAGTIPVAVYAIGMQFITMYKRFSSALSSLFLPRLSMMEAENASSKAFTDIMIKFGRIQFIILGLILSGFILYGEPFIRVWAGPSYSDAYTIVLLIMVPLTVPLIQTIGISILQAKNLHGFRSTVFLIIAILNIIVTIPLASALEGIGAAISTGVSLVLGHIIIMNIYYHKRIGINMILFWKNIIYMSLPVIISLMIGFTINYIVSENSLLLFSLKVIVFILVYSLLMWRFAMNGYEKDLFTSISKKLWRRVKRKA